MTTTSGRILVVEDDAILRETLNEVLADEGYDVREAGNGREALDVLEGWMADVIVLDLMMPHMDAFEFRHHQRTTGVSPASRILILSAARDLDAAARGIGAHAWLAKPFTLDEVLAEVARLLADRVA